MLTDQPERKAPLVHRDRKAQPQPSRAPRVPLVRRAPRGQPEQIARSLARRGFKAQPDHRVTPVLPGQTRRYPVPLAPTVPRGHKDRPAHRDYRVTPVLKAHRASKGSTVLLDRRGLRVPTQPLPVPPDHRAPRVQPVPKVYQAPTPLSPDQPARRVLRDRKVFRVQPVPTPRWLVRKGPKALKALKGRRVFRASRVTPARRDRLAQG